MTPSETYEPKMGYDCNYTIAPLSDSVPQLCLRPAIRSVILPSAPQRQMFYCYSHWQGVKDLPVMEKAAVEDLVEEPC